jgi:hypothetical protein
MKLLVCGGRTFTDKRWLESVLNKISAVKDIDLLIHGGARGADKLAGEWAFAIGVRVKECRADWSKFGKAAGPMRNSEMLKLKPDLVVAFPGGKGTADMVRKAKAAGVGVIDL